jgi:hypothetical protein
VDPAHPLRDSALHGTEMNVRALQIKSPVCRTRHHLNAVTGREHRPLFDDANRAARQRDDAGDFADVINHQRDVRRFVSDLRAADTHRQAHIGGRRPARIVHAVAAHRRDCYSAL